MTIAINGSGTITGISVGGLNDNIITKNEMATGGAWAPAGTVLQVVNANYTATVTSSTSTYADTGLTASITPTSATSKILVLVDCGGTGKLSVATSVGLQLVRNSTSLLEFEGFAAYTGNTTGNGSGSCSCNYLDSPATTSATTYKVQLKSTQNGASAYINATNGGNSASTITLMEIAA